MTRTELYQLIDDTVEAFKPCFSSESTRKWVKYFFESHWETFAYRADILDLKEEDYDTYIKYYNRWMKRGTEIIMPYVGELKEQAEKKAKKEVKRKPQDTKKKTTKRKKK